jgi:hypothetical protein
MKIRVSSVVSDRSFAGVTLSFPCKPMWNESLKQVQGDKYLSYKYNFYDYL